MSQEGIDNGHLAFVAAMKANDAHALGRTVTENALFMPPNEANVMGRENIVAWMEAVNQPAHSTDVIVFEREVSVPFRNRANLPG